MLGVNDLGEAEEENVSHNGRASKEEVVVRLHDRQGTAVPRRAACATHDNLGFSLRAKRDNVKHTVGSLLVLHAHHTNAYPSGMCNSYWIVSKSITKKTAFIVLEEREYSIYWHELMTNKGILYLKRETT